MTLIVYTPGMPHALQSKKSREEKHLDKQVTKILGWESHHSFCSTPIWINTLLKALPDSIMMSRIEGDWEATHADITVSGWTLPVALGHLIVAIDALDKETK